ncbi:hypothetical protein [Stenotrophomonas sp.]|uniref:hypothetical protein n=1 Tax=Stenotrophomonas sp. TaxID=69392 RepID=UPI0028AA0EDF|nr:hypothetical protein [Stenotrophomonas sp.]
MEGIMLLCGLLGALAIFIGFARLVAWVIDRREEQGIKAIRDAAFVAQARAEIAHRDYTISMLDQQDIHCADDFPGYAEFFLDDSATGKPEVRHA